MPKIDNGEGFGPCGMDACQVCDYIIKADTFTTRACGVVFKVKKGPLNCNSEKVFPVWIETFVMILPMLKKPKVSFISSMTIKNIKLLEKDYVQYCNKAIDDW